MTPKRWFWLAVALQVLLLVGVVGRHGFTLWTGQPVLLKTAPIDPWDPLRGEYVTLNYEISRFEGGNVPMAGTPYQSGQTVWVVLQKGEPYWTAVRLSASRPQDLSAGQVALRGRVLYYYADMGPDRKVEVALRYGIERFYVPEGQGREIENRFPQLSVEALVDPYGRAALTRLFVDGKEISFR